MRLPLSGSAALAQRSMSGSHKHAVRTGPVTHPSREIGSPWAGACCSARRSAASAAAPSGILEAMRIAQTAHGESGAFVEVVGYAVLIDAAAFGLFGLIVGLVSGLLPNNVWRLPQARLETGAVGSSALLGSADCGRGGGDRERSQSTERRVGRRAAANTCSGSSGTWPPPPAPHCRSPAAGKLNVAHRDDPVDRRCG